MRLSLLLAVVHYFVLIADLRHWRFWATLGAACLSHLVCVVISLSGKIPPVQLHLSVARWVAAALSERCSSTPQALLQDLKAVNGFIKKALFLAISV